MIISNVRHCNSNFLDSAYFSYNNLDLYEITYHKELMRMLKLDLFHAFSGDEFGRRVSRKKRYVVRNSGFQI